MSLFDGSLELSNEMMVNENNWSMIKSGFHEELTSTIKYIVETETPRSFYRDKENQKKITDVIEKYTGINVVISTGYKCFAMVPPDLNKNHTLINKIYREFYNNKELKKQKGTIEAFVDIKNFKVGGAFKDVKVELFLDPSLMWDTDFSPVVLTPAEVSAAILHEVGHMFSYFALAAHTYSINLPMLGTLNRIANTPDTEKVEIILKEWNDSDNTLTKVDVKELAGKDKQVIVTALISNQIKDTKSLMKQREYEEINTEYLADKFAVRCGAGVEAITALNKIFTIYGTRQTRGTVSYLFSEFISGFAFLISVDAIIGALTTTLNPVTTPILLMIGCFGIFSILTQNTNTGGDTVDTDINRFGRMRNDMVSMLKDKEIDKAVGKRVRDGIATIDKVVSKYRENKSLAGMLGDMVIGHRRRLLSQTEFYKELEKLSANSLFVAAYDLRNLK
jgi:hypothetical protein